MSGTEQGNGSVDRLSQALQRASASREVHLNDLDVQDIKRRLRMRRRNRQVLKSVVVVTGIAVLFSVLNQRQRDENVVNRGSRVGLETSSYGLPQQPLLVTEDGLMKATVVEEAVVEATASLSEAEMIQAKLDAWSLRREISKKEIAIATLIRKQAEQEYFQEVLNESE